MAPEKSVLLSPLDQLMPRSYISTALVFGVDDHATVVSRLQRGLEETCAKLPFLKGQIKEGSHQRKQLAISWDSTSPTPKIERKIAPENYPSYPTLEATGAPSENFPFSLFPTFSPTAHLSEPGAPVFGASYVEINGGLILCIIAHHNVLDGTGVGDVVRLWAENTRGDTASCGLVGLDSEEPLNRVPRIMQSLGANDNETEELHLDGLTQKHREFKWESRPQNQNSQARNSVAGSSKIFSFSGRKLAALKTSLADVVPLSSLTINNILCAIVWSHVSHTRAHRHDGPEASSSSTLGFAVNGRRVLGLAEPPYLGNINILTLAPVSFSEFKTSSFDDHTSLAPIISAIASATAKVDNNYIVELTQIVSLLPDLSDLGPGWDFFNGPDLSITSWANLGFYDRDFGPGIGNPGIVRIPFVALDGLGVILPRRRAKPGEVDYDETIQVTIMLREDDMESLCQNKAWQSWYAEG